MEKYDKFFFNNSLTILFNFLLILSDSVKLRTYPSLTHF